MLRNYVKIAWRNLSRTPGYSALNIIGLGIGMSVALLIGLWVHYQQSHDMQVPDAERLYRVQRNFNANGDTLTFRTTSLRLAEALRHDIPEIEYVAESDWMSRHGLKVGEKKIIQHGGIIGSDFLKMFKFPLLWGDRQSVFNDAYSIVLTKSTAIALFGSEDAIGKTVRFDNLHDLKVTGILQDLPANSSFRFNFLIPFSFLDQTQPFIKQSRTGSFGNNSNQIFVKLKEGTNYAQVAPKIREITHSEKNNVNAMNSFVTLQPLSRWHLYSNYVNGKDTEGFMEYVRMFTIIGVMVLLIACVNFINLTTARSERRAREVGVRKVIGSQRKDLIIQFLFESLLQTTLAFAVALLISGLLIRPFNEIAETKMELPLSNPAFWIIAIAGVVITSLIAGSRPAFVLSSYIPVKVLKAASASAGPNSALPRKLMFVFQFTASVALIIATFVVYQQIKHVKNRPTGFDLNKLVRVERSEDLARNYDGLRNELIQSGLVESVTSASSPATEVYWHNDLDNFPGKQSNETVEMGVILVTPDYFQTMGMSMKEGRNFKSAYDSTSVIFNEAAVKRLRIEQPINQKIKWGGDYQIAGVVKDALMISRFGAADPTMFVVSNEPQSNIMFRLKSTANPQASLGQIQKIFNKFNPAYPFDYSFEDKNYDDKLKTEALVGKLSGIFAFLAIFISCLGLFGLSAFVAASKTKEIGIRKVLGATISQVWLLLSKEFISLVIISCLIAIPLSWYFTNNWLQKYDYRVTIGPLVFITACLLSVIIAIITMSFESIKAAVANPIRSIKANE